MVRAWLSRRVGLHSAAVVLATVSLGACGSADVAQERAATEALDRTNQRVSGSHEQQTAAAFLDYASQHGRLKRCFAEEGVVYSPVLWVSDAHSAPGGRTYHLPLASLQDVQLYGFGEGHQLLTSWQQVRLQNSPIPLPAGYLKAAGTCGWSIDATAKQGSGVDEAWNEVVDRAYDDLGARADKEYAACVLAKTGRRVADPQQLRQQVSEMFLPFTVPGGPAVGTSASWKQAVSAETEAAVADLQCRTPIHARFAVAMNADIARFTATHASSLAETDRAWKQIVDQAAAAKAEWAKAHPDKVIDAS